MLPDILNLSRYLLAENHFQTIDIYEQQASFGGAWNYTPYVPSKETDIPQTNPHQPVETPVKLIQTTYSSFDTEKTRLIFSSPMYDRLETNIPKRLMQHSGKPFPEDAQLFPTRETVRRYLEEYAADVRHLVKFSSQVLDVRLFDKEGTWLVTIKDLVLDCISEVIYDGVIIANGHYRVPFVPDIKGIHSWNSEYQGSISHSKFYKRPDEFANKKVIVVGNSASGIDIGAQIGTVSKHPLLVSQRSESFLSQGTPSYKLEMPEIAEFLRPSHYDRAVLFADGRIETGIEKIIFCTGYLYSLPFLSSLNPPLLDDGNRVKNLYEHIFSIDHPNLAFIGLPLRIIPFPLTEAQAAVVARVWSGRLALPSESDMRNWEEATIAEHGAGRAFHAMIFPDELKYNNRLHDWAMKVSNTGVGKEPPRWSEEDAWARQRFPAIKRAFAERGEARHQIHSMEELGFDYEAWLSEQDNPTRSL